MCHSLLITVTCTFRMLLVLIVIFYCVFNLCVIEVEEDEFVKVGIISYVRDAQLMALELLQ